MTVTLDYKALIMLLKRKGSDLDQKEDGLCKRAWILNAVYSAKSLGYVLTAVVIFILL